MMICGMWLLARMNVNLASVARFDFIWDVAVGAVMGVFFLLLPSAGGFPVKKSTYTAVLWLPAFLVLVVIFYQYVSMISGIEAPFLRLLHNPGTRARMVEGAAVGYCAAAGVRGKI